MGMPRYLPNPGVEANPRIPLRDSLVSPSTFSEKYIMDLVSPIVWPEISQKSSRTSLMVEQFKWLALAKRTSSSVNIKWENTGPL